MQTTHFLQQLIGVWHGKNRTWFEPDKLADESAISAEFLPLLQGQFIRFSYQSEIQGKPRSGEATLCQNGVTGDIQINWFDDFHMNYAMLFSQGAATSEGWSVMGYYDFEVGSPQWGWRTQYQFIDDNHLIITEFNVTPDGQEAKAIETTLYRQA